MTPPPPESAVLIDCCEKVRKFRSFTRAEDDKFKSIIREALDKAKEEGRREGQEQERRLAAGMAEQAEVEARSEKRRAKRGSGDERSWAGAEAAASSIRSALHAAGKLPKEPA